MGALFYIWPVEKKIANNFLQAMSGGNFLNEKRNLDIIFAYTINLPWIIQQRREYFLCLHKIITLSDSWILNCITNCTRIFWPKITPSLFRENSSIPFYILILEQDVTGAPGVRAGI